MLAQRRPAPLSAVGFNSCPSVTSTSSAGTESDWDTPGLMSLGESATETESETPPETPVGPIIKTDNDDKKAFAASSTNNLEDHIPILLSTNAPLVHSSSYWDELLPGEADLGYEAEVEVDDRLGRGLVRTVGCKRAGSKPSSRPSSRTRFMRTNGSHWSSKRHVHHAKAIHEDSTGGEGDESGQGGDSGVATPRGPAACTPVGSAAPTPTTTPKLSGTGDTEVDDVELKALPPLQVEDIALAEAIGLTLPAWRLPPRLAAVTGLGLGLPSRLSNSVIPGRVDAARIHSAPARPAPPPGTPVITSTPRFDSPAHKDAITSLASPTDEKPGSSPILASAGEPFHQPPPKARLAPTMLALIPSPLELPESHQDNSSHPADKRRLASSATPPRQAHLPGRRAMSLNLGLLSLRRKNFNTDPDDPQSPFYSPMPPSLRGSPRLQHIQRGGTPSPKRTPSLSVSAYAGHLQDRREALGRKTSLRGGSGQEHSEAPPPGFKHMPLSPEMPPARDLMLASSERIRDVVRGAELRVSGEKNPYFPAA